MPVAGDAIHRPAGGVSLCTTCGGPPACRGPQGDPVRCRRRGAFSRRAFVQLRRLPAEVPPDGSGLARAGGYFPRGGHGSSGPCPPGGWLRRHLPPPVPPRPRRSPAPPELAVIVRGADTDRLGLAPQAAGLLAISLGLSQLFPDDHELLARGFVIYDALYAWLQHAKGERHTWNPRRVPASA